MRNELQEKELELLKKLCASENVSFENEGMLVKRLYKHMDYDVDDAEYFLDILENDVEHDIINYHTITSNKMQYFWYIDERRSVAIDIDGNIYDDEYDDDDDESFSKLEGILY